MKIYQLPISLASLYNYSTFSYRYNFIVILCSILYDILRSRFRLVSEKVSLQHLHRDWTDPSVFVQLDPNSLAYDISREPTT